MKVTTLPFLCCPLCQSSLEIEITSQEQDEIIEGFLSCFKCKNTYPILEKIPRIIPNYFGHNSVKEFSETNNNHDKIREANIIYHNSVAND